MGAGHIMLGWEEFMDHRVPYVLTDFLAHEFRDARDRERTEKKRLEKQRRKLAMEKAETADRLKEKDVPVILVKRT
jgi:hypothetical protein